MYATLACRQAARTASPKKRVPRSARRFEQAFTHGTPPTPGSPHRSQVHKGARHAFEKALAAEQEAAAAADSTMQSPVRARMRDLQPGLTGAEPASPAQPEAAHGSAARLDLSHHSYTGGEALHAPIRTSVTPINPRCEVVDALELPLPRSSQR